MNNSDTQGYRQVGRYWHFDDGTVLPVVSGGDGPDDDTGGENGDQGSGESEYSLGPDFLKSVPENERPIVEKYVNDWDKKVAERFQGIHAEYKPYKDLGSHQNLQQAVAIAKALEDSPEAVLSALLKEDFAKDIVEQYLKPFTQTGVQNQNGGAGQNNLQGLPPEVQARIDQQEKVLAQLSQLVIGNQRMTQQQQEDAQLDAYLTDLKTKHGEFDEEAVLLRMNRGMEGPAAIKDWQESLKKWTGAGPQQKPTPPGLGGGSVIPQGTDVSKMSSKDTRDLVANMLAAANNEG